MYDQNLKSKRAYYNALDYAKKEAIKEGRAEGKAEGRAEGKAEGKAEEKKEIAIAMLAKGIDMHTISDITKLSINDIEKLSSK